MALWQISVSVPVILSSFLSTNPFTNCVPCLRPYAHQCSEFHWTLIRSVWHADLSQLSYTWTLSPKIIIVEAKIIIRIRPGGSLMSNLFPRYSIWTNIKFQFLICRNLVLRASKWASYWIESKNLSTWNDMSFEPYKSCYKILNLVRP